MSVKKYSMRKAFSMITAIFLIVLMGTVAAFVMNLSGKMVKETTTQYKKEQAILFAKSYTEFAIMAATAQNCIQNIQANIGAAPLVGNGYHIEVQAQYIGNDLANPPANCPNTVGLNAINNAQSRGAILLLDTYVHYRDPADPNALAGVNWANNRGLVYHRRTLQRL